MWLVLQQQVLVPVRLVFLPLAFLRLALLQLVLQVLPQDLALVPVHLVLEPWQQPALLV